VRILMIEDDEKLCEVVCYHLEREGFTVDVCHDGDDDALPISMGMTACAGYANKLTT